MSASLPWVVFVLLFLGVVGLDLGVFHRGSRVVGPREALRWTAVWILLAVVVAAGIGVLRGPQSAVEFVTAYVIEKALSIDNLFVFLVIFTQFRVPAAHQYRVLALGMVGAIVMRAVLIAVGGAAVQALDWLPGALGLFLVYSGIKLVMSDPEGDGSDASGGRWLDALGRIVPFTKEFHGADFFVRVGGRWRATPLVAVLLVIEASDLAFATDSIPAALGVSADPFIVFSSNAMAVLGLRSLYFFIASVLPLFRFLRQALCLILTFIGSKMLVAGVVTVPAILCLAVIFTVIVVAIAASILRPLPASPPGLTAAGDPPAWE